MLSLDLLNKVAKRLDFHSTATIFLDFFEKDQTSLNITRLHSTHSTRWPNGSIFSSNFCRVKNRVKIESFAQGLRLRVRRTLERFCMQPFRLGSYRVLFTLCLGNALCRTVLFKAFMHEQFQTTASLSFHQEHRKFLKDFPTIHLFFEGLHTIFFESRFTSYRQLSPVEFPLASFLSVPDGNGSGSLHENFLVRFRAGATFLVYQFWYR